VNPSNAVPAHLAADLRFREGLKTLARLGLTFDAWLYHPQIDELTEMARAVPDVPIVLNHCGGPLAINAYAGRQAEVFDAWSRSIRQLATCPNVYIKLGGLGMRINGLDLERGSKPVSSQELADKFRPFFETCIEAFGANRCMFESNFPVDKGAYPYAAYWNACKRIAGGATASDKAALFGGTATRFYRLEV